MLKQPIRKNMVKRPFLGIVFMCLVILSLAACGSNGGSGAGSTPTATSTPLPTPSPKPSSTPLPTLSPKPSSTPVPFKVTSIDMAVSPTSIAGMACGIQITVIYNATFHIAANSAGGTIHFVYTVNNGRSSPGASVNVSPGQTTATYSFTWSGKLPPDHTYPGLGGVITSSPNVVNSPLVKPVGVCS